MMASLSRTHLKHDVWGNLVYLEKKPRKALSKQIWSYYHLTPIYITHCHQETPGEALGGKLAKQQAAVAGEGEPSIKS